MMSKVVMAALAIWCLCLNAWLIHLNDGLTEATRYSQEASRVLRVHAEAIIKLGELTTEQAHLLVKVVRG